MYGQEEIEVSTAPNGGNMYLNDAVQMLRLILIYESSTFLPKRFSEPENEVATEFCTATVDLMSRCGQFFCDCIFMNKTPMHGP